MNATQLLAHFDRLAEAPNAVSRLRRFILDLAARRKLTDSIGIEEHMTTLGKLADFIMGQAPPGHTCNEIGEGTLFVKVGEFGVRYPEARAWTTQPLRFAQAGDVLVCVVGATVGKLNLAVDCAIGRSVAAIRPSERIRTEYLYYSLMPFTLRLRDSARGSAQGVISKPDLANIKLWCPSLEEQAVVVSKINELMALCDQLEAAQQERERRRDRLAAASLQRLNQPADATNPETQREHARFHLHHLPRLTTRPEHIKAMRQTFFNLAVCGRLVAQDADDEPVMKLLKRLGVQVAKSQADASSPIIPAAWAWVTIDQIANVSSGTTPSRDVSEYYSPDGTPWVTSGETSNAFITATAQHVSDRALKDTSLKLYPPGTLIVAMYGQGKTRGQVAELSIAATTNQACAAIVLKLEDVGHRRYVKLFFQKIYEEIRELAAGGAQPNLNGGKIKSTLIPLPPLAEQHRIVAKVDELMALCDQLEAQLTTTKTDSRRLLEAVLDAAIAPA